MAIFSTNDISIHPYGFGPGTGFDSAPFLSTYASALPLRFALCTDLCALALRFQAFLEVPRIGASLPSLPWRPKHCGCRPYTMIIPKQTGCWLLCISCVAAHLTFVLHFPRTGSCLSSVSESKGALILSVIPDSLPGPIWRIVRFRMKQAPHCMGLTFPIWFRSSTLLSNGHDETSLKPVSSYYLPLRHMKKAAVADFSPPNLLGSKPRSGW